MHASLAAADEVPKGQEPGSAGKSTSCMDWSSEELRVSIFSGEREVRNKQHINVSEMSAALRSESRRCKRYPRKRLLMGSDLQALLGAIVKGCSSSKVLNGQVKRVLPTVLAYNCYSYTQYKPTMLHMALYVTECAAIRSAQPLHGLLTFTAIPMVDWMLSWLLVALMMLALL